MNYCFQRAIEILREDKDIFNEFTDRAFKGKKYPFEDMPYFIIKSIENLLDTDDNSLLGEFLFHVYNILHQPITKINLGMTYYLYACGFGDFSTCNKKIT